MDITSAQREQIYRGNALKFLKPAHHVLAKVLQTV
jgi:hypothetical protein